MRLEEAGSVDTTFGAGGLITSHPNGDFSFADLNYGYSALVVAGSDIYAARGYYDNGSHVLRIQHF